MEVKLVVSAGKHAGTQIPVAGPLFLIGRAEECQLRPTAAKSTGSIARSRSSRDGP